MDTTLRPMSISQLLDRTFHLYRNNFLLFAGIAALPPAMLVVAQLAVLILQQTMSGLSETATLVVGCSAALSALVFLLVYMLGTALATGATVHAVSCVHLGNPVTIVESYRAVRPLTWRILGVSLLISLMVGAALMVVYFVVIIPVFMGAALMKSSGPAGMIVGCAIAVPLLIVGIGLAAFLNCRYSLAVPACVLEKLGVMACLQRSVFLSKKALWRIFLIFVLTLILAISIELALSIPNYIAVGFRGVPSLPFQIWGIIAGFLSKAIAVPIGTIALSLVYFDQRVRKEAFDLQLMMQAMEEPVAPPPVMPPPILPPPPPPPAPPPAAPPAIGS